MSFDILFVVGLNPTIPQHKAGNLMLPAVSLPIAAFTNPSLTKQASPPEEPPAILSKLYGFLTGPKILLNDSIENKA